MNEFINKAEEKSTTALNGRYAIEKPLLALEALAKLNRQFANKPEFHQLIRTLLLTLSGQFSVGSAFAHLKKPGSGGDEYTYLATGKYLSNPLLESLKFTSALDHYFLENRIPCLVSELNLTDICRSTQNILSENKVQLICPVIHNDKILGVIALGEKVTKKQFEQKDIELFDTLLYSITPLIACSYQFWEVANLSAWYFDILNNVKQGLFAFGSDNRLKKINSAGLYILHKYNPNVSDTVSLYNTSIEEIFPEEIYKDWVKYFIKAVTENFCKSIDNLIVESENEKFFYDGYVCRISGGSEFQNDYILTLENVTDRKNAENDLRKSGELLRATLDSSANGILVVDEKGKVTQTNVRFYEMWRIPKELIETNDDNALLNYAISQLKDPGKFLKKVQELYQSTREDTDLINFKDGRVFERYSCPLIHNDQIAGRVWSFTDITKRLESEEQERELRGKLDRAERMEALGVLAGGVAHDLNNMLGPLVGYPELILKKLSDDNPIRKQVEKIGSAAQNAASVIQDLLALARRGRYEMEPLNLNHVIEEYLESPSYMKKSLDFPNVNVTVNLDNNISNIIGSAPHLSKVIMNLIVNAYDAMPEGGELLIRSSNAYLDKLIGGYDRIDEGKYVLLHVKDSGIGIEKKDLDRIFEPYYSNKKMGSSGSGLGLSVVYGILKDHNGYYDVLSEVGEGTEIILYIPATEEAVQVSDESEDFCGTEILLVVDDVEEQREIAAEMLTSLGYKIHTVPNGREAVKFIDNRKVDLVILDMIMEKDFDGLDTYQEIIKNHPGQRAIVISGFSVTDRVDKIQKLGAGSFIKKPFTLDTIGRAVREVLDVKDKS